jgi:hypothetical protein
MQMCRDTIETTIATLASRILRGTAVPEKTKQVSSKKVTRHAPAEKTGADQSKPIRSPLPAANIQWVDVAPGRLVKGFGHGV